MLRRYLFQAIFFCMPLLVSTTCRAQEVQAVRPMAKDAHPSFEVATIKPHDPSSDYQGFDVAGHRVTIRNEGLVAMLTVSYSLHRSQIIGLPSWAREKWDIEGTTDVPGQPDLRQQQEMIQTLLGDRFALRFHREQREVPVYLLQMAKGGPKLKPAARPDDETGQVANGHDGIATFQYSSTDMSDFILGESLFLDRPLLDRTGLTGKYDFTLRYNFKDDVGGAATDDANSVPGLFRAVEEELGLKLVSTKATVEVLVIDHVDRPSAN